jgi:roadblock/LC7 domain-containing protein
MSILTELSAMPGVISAGEYSYRGDRFTYKGHMDDEQARQASIMCRATTMSVHMQAEMLSKFCPECGIHPNKGWIVQGPQFTVCVVANVFCFLNESQGSLNQIFSYMREKLFDESDELV